MRARRKAEAAAQAYKKARREEYEAFIVYLNEMGVGPFTDREAWALVRRTHSVDRHRERWLKKVQASIEP